MDIELLVIPDCPNSSPARELLAHALALEGIDPELITVREISADADAHAFRGSPTFRIDGKDFYPSTAEPAVTCRVYRQVTACPGSRRSTRCGRPSGDFIEPKGLTGLRHQRLFRLPAAGVRQ